MALTVNTEKSVGALTLCLQKRGVDPIPVDVAMAMDVSGSFDHAHKRGITNDLITRLIPWGLVFDPDKKIGFYTFSHAVDVCPDVTENNYQGFMAREVVERVSGYNGSTYYAPVIERILNDTSAKKAGLVSRLFGGKKEVAEKPLLVLFITDGENSDERETINVLNAAERDGRKCYFIFLGVNSDQRQFDFIRKLGDKFNNTAFVPVTDLQSFVNMSDDELNSELIGDELIEWFKTLNK